MIWIAFQCQTTALRFVTNEKKPSEGNASIREKEFRNFSVLCVFIRTGHLTLRAKPCKFVPPTDQITWNLGVWTIANNIFPAVKFESLVNGEQNQIA